MSRDVGGDFYHFQMLGQEQVAIAIGDVMGHGTGAALIMSVIMGILKADRTDHRRPERVVSRLNDMLIRLGDFVEFPITCSLFYGVVDLPSGLLLYINAGHPHPIVYHRTSGRLNHLPATTMLLGVQSGVKEDTCHQFEQGDRLILYTDGLVDCRDADQKPFGRHRLEEMIQAAKSIDLNELGDQIFSEQEQHLGLQEAEDDMTLVGIDFNQSISPGI